MLLDPARGYDLIGDIHGCARALERLLAGLGYRRVAGVWRHPQRMAVFLGDLVDRGPHIRETLHLVHDMVEAGQALCLMGNHEWYALGWSTPALPGSGRRYVREHVPRHERLIRETLAQLEGHPGDWRDFLAWFQTLPLCVDAGRFRLVHACWDAGVIERLLRDYPDARVDRAFVQQAGDLQSFAAHCFQRLLRGIDMPLPRGLTLTSSDGFTRSVFRTKFWEEDPKTYGDIVFQPDALPDEVASLPLSNAQKAALLRYGDAEPLLFVGHYWCRGTPGPLRPNLACLDYSAVRRGKLVAYRLDEEIRLEPHKFFWVEVGGGMGLDT